MSVFSPCTSDRAAVGKSRAAVGKRDPRAPMVMLPSRARSLCDCELPSSSFHLSSFATRLSAPS
eukprot:6052679-Pleurochrysis_carterae.AAC.4